MGKQQVKINTTQVVNTVNIQNNTGRILPGTGGMGVYAIFGAGGIMAMLLGAAYIIYRKKGSKSAAGA